MGQGLTSEPRGTRIHTELLTASEYTFALFLFRSLVP